MCRRGGIPERQERAGSKHSSAPITSKRQSFLDNLVTQIANNRANDDSTGTRYVRFESGHAREIEKAASIGGPLQPHLISSRSQCRCFLLPAPAEQTQCAEAGGE
jgi:hypothetical protein